jgi:hypothetical protein
MDDQCYPAAVDDAVIIHWHRPSQDCNNSCHVVPACDLPDTLRLRQGDPLRKNP